MLRIVETEIDSEHSINLHKILLTEWSDITRIYLKDLGLAIPNPIVALEDNQVVGGLVFTSYKEPNTDKIVTWINALYVNKNKRGRNIASKLIQAAKGTSESLYALTDIPNLYVKAGWEIVQKDIDGIVMKQGSMNNKCR